MSLTYYLMENIIKQIHILVQNINETIETIQTIKKKSVYGHELGLFGFTVDEINEILRDENIVKFIEDMENRYYKNINNFYRIVADRITVYDSVSVSDEGVHGDAINQFFEPFDADSKKNVDPKNAIYDVVVCRIRSKILGKILIEYQTEIDKNIKEIIRIEPFRNLSDTDTLSKIQENKVEVYKKIKEKIKVIITKMYEKLTKFDESQE
jgi:hypothetical protein